MKIHITLLYLLLYAFIVLPSQIAGQELTAVFPHVVLDTGRVRMTVFTPDLKLGFYRGTRFEWSGMVWQLAYRGHTFFVPRRMPHDPENLLHGMSLAAEFSPGVRKEIPVRFTGAAPGETFMKIGVGTLQKSMADTTYNFRTVYPIIDPGVWTTETGPNWIRCTHTLTDTYGNAYKYSRMMSLSPDMPVLTMTYTLENIGTTTITADHYNHNFWLIDSQPPGPSYEVTLGFDAVFDRDISSHATLDGKTIRFLQDVKAPFHSTISGYNSDPSDNRIIITNHAAGAGVEITGDYPIWDFQFYVEPESICPELFAYISVPPGETQTWQTTYRLFTVAE